MTRPRRLLVSVGYLGLLRHYAAEVDAELARLDALLHPDSEAGRRHDWLGAYLDLRVSVEMLALVLAGLVTDPRLPEGGPRPSSPGSAEAPSLSLAD